MGWKATLIIFYPDDVHVIFCIRPKNDKFRASRSHSSTLFWLVHHRFDFN